MNSYQSFNPRHAALSTILSSWSIYLFTVKVHKKNGYVLFTTKAYNGRVVTEWLNSCLCEALSRPNEFNDADGEISLLCSCMKLCFVLNCFGSCFIFVKALDGDVDQISVYKT